MAGDLQDPFVAAKTSTSVSQHKKKSTSVPKCWKFGLVWGRAISAKSWGFKVPGAQVVAYMASKPARFRRWNEHPLISQTVEPLGILFDLVWGGPYGAKCYGINPSGTQVAAYMAIKPARFKQCNAHPLISEAVGPC